jgi:N-acetylglucosaminyldiphosphoundecaprenol N-acetyl-beta-D-mannosaminyltransferase
MRAFYERARHIYIDGMPLVWLGRLLGHPLSRKHRPTCIEYMRPVLAEAAQRGWRVFYLGSRPEVVERGLDIFEGEIPGLNMATAHGYFDARPHSEENRKVLERIAAYQPNILMVGMGMPRQEHWILENIDLIQANVIINVGACLDFLVGAKYTPPRWLGQIGLEWVYRLVTEPRRLWRRYLLEPWFIAGVFLREWLGRIDKHRGNG